MSNDNDKVWVTWKDPNNQEDLHCRVTGLKDGAIIDDLRTAFLLQRREQAYEHMGPEKVEVRTKGGEVLDEELKINDFFVADDVDNPPKAGQRKATALVLTLPPAQQQQQQQQFQVSQVVQCLCSSIWIISTFNTAA